MSYASRTATPYVANWAIGRSLEGLTTDEQEGSSGWNYYESDVVGHYKFEVLGQPVQSQYPRIWLQAGMRNGILSALILPLVITRFQYPS